MRTLTLSCAAALLVACTQPATEVPQADEEPIAQTLEYMHPQYEEGWNLEDYWAGEYPNGIGIYREGVEVMGRVTPHPDEPASTNCALSYLASYHPWNDTRVEADKLEFKTAFMANDWMISEDTTVELQSENDAIQKQLQAGDIITVVAYYAEGWGDVEIDGERFTANLGAFPIDEVRSTGVNDRIQDDEWLGLDCGKERRYVLLSDLHEMDGISFGLEGMQRYGVMADLTEEQAATLRVPGVQ